MKDEEMPKIGFEPRSRAVENRIGDLMMDGWAGVRAHQVEIIGETPQRYRIRAIERTKLAGRCRWINPGETALVPKYAVRNVRHSGDGIEAILEPYRNPEGRSKK